jgi:hypothetical protein
MRKWVSTALAAVQTYVVIGKPMTLKCFKDIAAVSEATRIASGL